MRKITAIAVALGFLTSVSLPAFATPAANGVVKSDELSAKKKKKTEKKDEKKSALGADAGLAMPRYAMRPRAVPPCATATVSRVRFWCHSRMRNDTAS